MQVFVMSHYWSDESLKTDVMLSREQLRNLASRIAARLAESDRERVGCVCRETPGDTDCVVHSPAVQS